MKKKHLIIFTFLIISISSMGQNNDFGDWTQELKRDDFGDLENYSYDYLGYDKFSSNYLYVRVEKVGLGIYQSIDGANFISYDRMLSPYSIKIKNTSGYIYDDTTNLISGTGGIVLKVNSNLYQLLTNGNGNKFSIVIYDDLGNRINSFNVSSFQPYFK